MRNNSSQNNQGGNVKRRLFNAMAGVSLVFFSISVLLSEYTRFYTLKYDSGTSWRIAIAQGDVGFVHEIVFSPRPARPPRWSISAPYEAWDVRPTLGLSWITFKSQFYTIWEVSVAMYWIAAATTVLPLYWFITGRHWESFRRQQLNLCVRCGYDLRATPDRCPECGEVPNKSEKIST
jgi:hypothetical protein